MLYYTGLFYKAKRWINFTFQPVDRDVSKTLLISYKCCTLLLIDYFFSEIYFFSDSDEKRLLKVIWSLCDRLFWIFTLPYKQNFFLTDIDILFTNRFTSLLIFKVSFSNLTVAATVSEIIVYKRKFKITELELSKDSCYEESKKFENASLQNVASNSPLKSSKSSFNLFDVLEFFNI